jgi:hypothetical protein
MQMRQPEPAAGGFPHSRHLPEQCADIGFHRRIFQGVLGVAAAEPAQPVAERNMQIKRHRFAGRQPLEPRAGDGQAGLVGEMRRCRIARVTRHGAALARQDLVGVDHPGTCSGTAGHDMLALESDMAAQPLEEAAQHVGERFGVGRGLVGDEANHRVGDLVGEALVLPMLVAQALDGRFQVLVDILHRHQHGEEGLLLVFMRLVDHRVDALGQVKAQLRVGNLGQFVGELLELPAQCKLFVMVAEQFRADQLDVRAGARGNGMTLSS